MNRIVFFVMAHPKLAMCLAVLGGLLIEALTGVTVEVGNEAASLP